ncbi:MAG: PDC sensor domain-containing protein [Helicobacteraceae bacterium]|jgi:hypothetical protein|nr:PDC sensor domain-containing protein [Helicobacteraceae bacterium]
MIIRDIRQFAEIRYQARAYLTYLFTRNLHNRMPEPLLDSVLVQLDKIANEVNSFDAIYVLDPKGEQVIDNIANDLKLRVGKGIDRSSKAYYYRAVREKRCVLTDPYPSGLTNDLCVTASFPLYDESGVLRYIICIDVSLSNIIKICQSTKLDLFFASFSKIIYTLFSFALLMVACVVFTHGIESFFEHGISISNINTEDMFRATILLTLALAIFDLVKTIFEEEVLGHSKKVKNGSVHKTMVRFLGSIVIALAIEALMLVFKFVAKDQAEHIVYAVYLIGAVTMLLIGLSLYIYLTGGKKSKICRSN